MWSDAFHRDRLRAGYRLARAVPAEDRRRGLHPCALVPPLEHGLLHDNDGQGDQHALPFSGTVLWATVVPILAASAYGRCVTLECRMRTSGFTDEPAFLAAALRAAQRLSEQIQVAKRGVR